MDCLANGSTSNMAMDAIIVLACYAQTLPWFEPVGEARKPLSTPENDEKCWSVHGRDRAAPQLHDIQLKFLRAVQIQGRDQLGVQRETFAPQERLWRVTSEPQIRYATRKVRGLSLPEIGVPSINTYICI